MPYRFICPQGHQWEPLAAGRSPGTGVQGGCPVCGADGTLRLLPDASTASANSPPVGASPTMLSDGSPKTARNPDATSPAQATPFPAVPAMPTIPGFEIFGELGRGGMGVVYKARQTGLNRVVALKMILAGAHASVLQLARFQLEAEAVGSLQHPNIVQVHEIGQHDRCPYFSLEYVDGGSLDQRLAGFPQPPRSCAALVERLARAIHCAHLRGIIHRDLKPANVLLAHSDPLRGVPVAGPSGVVQYFEPKITDFGLAKRLELEEASFTQTGAIMGTANYMAPEQAEGRSKEVGPLTDVYALGAILYEMLTGRPPFEADTAVDVVQMVRRDEPVAPARALAQSKSQGRNVLPRDLETICLKCLSKDAKKRYASADALADDLRRFLRGEPILARPVGAGERCVKWVKRRPAAAGMLLVCGAAALVLLAGGVWSFREVRSERDQANAAEQRAKRDQEEAEINFRRAQAAVDTMLTEVAQDEKLANEPDIQHKQRALLEKALAYYQGFLRERHADPKVRTETALAYHRVGEISRILGRHDPARVSFDEAIHLLGQLAEEFPADPAHRQRLAESYNFLGESLRQTSQMPQALEAYGSAQKLQEALMAESPGEPAYRQELARTQYNRGIVLKDTNRHTEADRAFGRSVQILRDLVAKDPARPVYRQHLARSLFNIDPMPGTPEQLAEAEKGYREAVALLGDLTKQHPKHREYRHELGVATNNLGNVLRRQKRQEEAEAEHRRALELFRKLALDFASVPDYRQEMANTHNSLGIVFTAGDKLPEAESEWTKAAGTFAELAGEFPDIAGYRGDLGMAHGNLGWVRLQRGDPAKARFHLEQGIEHLQTALRQNPDNPDYRATLRRRYGDLVAANLQEGNHAAAAKAARALPRAPKEPEQDCYWAARLLARCASWADKNAVAPVGSEAAPSQQYADQAVQFLREALALGYKDYQRLHNDPDLQLLRRRQDFPRQPEEGAKPMVR